MLYRLQNHVLLNHITNNIMLQLGNIILQVVSATYSTEAIHTWAMWSSYSAPAILQLSPTDFVHTRLDQSNDKVRFH